MTFSTTYRNLINDPDHGKIRHRKRQFLDCYIAGLTCALNIAKSEPDLSQSVARIEEEIERVGKEEA